MNSELLENAKRANRFYYLAVKYEKRLQKSVVEFAKKTCDNYTKMAKQVEVEMSQEDLIKNILK